MPSDYLLKTEPSVYSFADLQKDGVTIWDGVTNPHGSEEPSRNAARRAVWSSTKPPIRRARSERPPWFPSTHRIRKLPSVKIKAGKGDRESRGRWRKSKPNKLFADSPLVRDRKALGRSAHKSSICGVNGRLIVPI